METGLLKTARDLVYVHSNLRLLENIQAVNCVETTVEWKQWAVADSDSEYTDLSLTCHCLVFL